MDTNWRIFNLISLQGFWISLEEYLLIQFENILVGLKQVWKRI